MSGFSAFAARSSTVRLHRQETQIVQSCMTLDDFLPGFRHLPIRWTDDGPCEVEIVDYH